MTSPLLSFGQAQAEELDQVCEAVGAAMDRWQPLLVRAPAVTGTVPAGSRRIARWLEEAQPRYPGFGMIRRGEEAPPPEITRSATVRGRPDEGLPQVPAIQRKLVEGYMLVLSDMEAWDPDFAAFTAALEAAFGVRATSTCILSPPGEWGFPRHDDPEHVLIWQLEGEKRWVFDPPLDEVVLRAGDVLYLPPSIPHQVFGTEQGSCHVTVGLQPLALPVAVAQAVRTAIGRHVPAVEPWSEGDYAVALEAVAQELAARPPAPGRLDGRPRPVEERRFTASLEEVCGLPAPEPAR